MDPDVPSSTGMADPAFPFHHRMLLCPVDLTFYDFRSAIQVAFGRTNQHAGSSKFWIRGLRFRHQF